MPLKRLINFAVTKKITVIFGDQIRFSKSTVSYIASSVFRAVIVLATSHKHGLLAMTARNTLIDIEF